LQLEALEEEYVGSMEMTQEVAFQAPGHTIQITIQAVEKLPSGDVLGSGKIALGDGLDLGAEGAPAVHVGSQGLGTQVREGVVQSGDSQGRGV
jgi:hypothetical protein